MLKMLIGGNWGEEIAVFSVILHKIGQNV